MLKIYSGRIVIYILTLFIALNIQAQSDSIPNNLTHELSIYYYKQNQLFKGFPELKQRDTLPDFFWNYEPREPQNDYQYHLGNLGLPYQHLIYRPEFVTGFNYRSYHISDYRFTPENTLFFQTIKPYTYVKYITGPNKEDLLQVFHSQNIAQSLNIGFEYKLIDSYGNYLHQESDHNFVRFYANYFSKNRKYMVNGGYYRNRLWINENGGIKHDSLFTGNVGNNRLTLQVNLEQAQSRWLEKQIYLHQTYFFTRPDSALSSSPFSFGRISHTFRYSRFSNTYEDLLPKSGYYPNIFSDSIQTLDSTLIQQYSNTLEWSNETGSNLLPISPLRLTAGIVQTISSLSDATKTKNFIQLTPYAKLDLKVLKEWLLTSKIIYKTGDYDNSDFLAEANLIKVNSEKNTVIYAGFLFQNQQPSYFYQSYQSNHFRWNNTFRTEKTSRLSFGYTSEKLGASLNYNNIQDYVYLNETGIPEVNAEQINLIQAQIEHNLHIGRMKIRTQLLYQKSSQKSGIVLPEFQIQQSIFFNYRWFKKALFVQPGIEWFYMTSTYSNVYIPALQDFSTQNKIKTGNFVYADIFLNVLIKRATLFFKIQNVAAGAGGFNYIVTPHYPLQDRALKFGVQWKFFD